MTSDRLYEKYYYSVPGWRNGYAEFYDLIAQATAGRRAAQILEVGCGPTNCTTEFLAGLGTVRGADIDPAAADNRFLSDFRLIQPEGEEPLGYEDASFDCCVSSWVIEHVSDPARHLRLIHRALKPSGRYVLMTPNLFHYVSLVSYLTPYSFHKAVANMLRRLPEEAPDPYPTFYRMNTGSAIGKQVRDSGFEIESLRRFEKEPAYARASAALFYPMMLYERLVNRWELLRALRHTFIVTLRRI